MLRPDSEVDTVIPSIAGTSSSPASVGLAPVVVCRNSGTNTLIANSAAVARKRAALTSATVRVRSRCSGTIGSEARRSRHTSAPACGCARGEAQAQARERRQSDGEVDVEDPAPARVVYQEAADERPDDRCDGEGGRDVALVTAALARGDEVSDGGHRQRHEPAGGRAL